MITRLVSHARWQRFYFLAIWREFYTQKYFWRYFSFVFGVYFLGYFALLVYGENYSDDYNRATYGVFHFYFNGRWLTEYGSKLAHLSFKRVVDISPLLQIMAIALLSLGSLLLIRILHKKFTIFNILSSVPLGLSPFFCGKYEL